MWHGGGWNPKTGKKKEKRNASEKQTNQLSHREFTGVNSIRLPKKKKEDQKKKVNKTFAGGMTRSANMGIVGASTLKKMGKKMENYSHKKTPQLSHRREKRKRLGGGGGQKNNRTKKGVKATGVIEKGGFRTLGGTWGTRIRLGGCFWGIPGSNGRFSGPVSGGRFLS